MNRPIIRIKPNTIDLLAEFIGLAALLFMIFLPLYHFTALPSELPSHFNFKGEPNSTASRNIIWLLPAIGLVLYSGLSVLSRYPHMFNYPVQITEVNAKKVYTLGIALVRYLKVLIIVVFLYLETMIIHIGLGKASVIGKHSLPVFAGISIVIIAVMVIRIIRIKK